MCPVTVFFFGLCVFNFFLYWIGFYGANHHRSQIITTHRPKMDWTAAVLTDFWETSTAKYKAALLKYRGRNEFHKYLPLKQIILRLSLALEAPAGHFLREEVARELMEVMHAVSVPDEGEDDDDVNENSGVQGVARELMVAEWEKNNDANEEDAVIGIKETRVDKNDKNDAEEVGRSAELVSHRRANDSSKLNRQLSLRAKEQARTAGSKREETISRGSRLEWRLPKLDVKGPKQSSRPNLSYRQSSNFNSATGQNFLVTWQTPRLDVHRVRATSPSSGVGFQPQRINALTSREAPAWQRHRRLLHPPSPLVNQSISAIIPHPRSQWQPLDQRPQLRASGRAEHRFTVTPSKLEQTRRVSILTPLAEEADEQVGDRAVEPKREIVENRADREEDDDLNRKLQSLGIYLNGQDLKSVKHQNFRFNECG